MVDTISLKNAVKNSGLKYGYISEKLGISYMTLSRKIKGTYDFNASEIVKLTDMLALTKAERDRIFLS
ncbi:MAG: helix-turn-helix transcriptional regulator [Ruminococcus sp.]|nr:helix-turn-helix transcriptional regulator [Ruminococcus sp.]